MNVPESEDDLLKLGDDRTLYFYFDDNPRPAGINKMWLLNTAWEEPYNNAHLVGVGVVEVEDVSNSEKLYKRIGMFHNGQSLSHSMWDNKPMHTFTII